MAVVAQPGRNQLRLVNVDGHRDFSTGLLACCSGCDCVTCLCTLFCLPCMMCQIAIRINECPLMPCFVGGMPIRTKIRTMGGIDGSICCDCIVLYLCGACVICQLSRELDMMGL